MKRIAIEDRPLGKKLYLGYPLTSLPDIFSDELTENDFIMVSHMIEDKDVKRKFSSHKIQLSELIGYLKTKI